MEFTLGIVFTNTTLTLQPITSVRGVLKDGTEVDGESYLDYYNEQIAAYENIIIHYTVTDEFMTWDYEVFGPNPFAEDAPYIPEVRQDQLVVNQTVNSQSCNSLRCKHEAPQSASAGRRLRITASTRNPMYRPAHAALPLWDSAQSEAPGRPETPRGRALCIVG